MQLFHVTLKTTTPVGPLNVSTSHTFYVEQGEIDTLTEMALAEGWHFTAVPVVTHSAENVVWVFKRTIELDTDF